MTNRFVFLLLLGMLFYTQASGEGRKMMFSCPTSNISEFEAFVVRAKALGATHIFVSDLPKSLWQWEMDLSDPYPNWSMFNASVFKILPPPEIAEYIPEGYHKRNVEILKERAAVLKKHGLKAAFKGGEPAWLPEGVYREHPEWRGARCEHPRRARRAYFSPNIDNPEVLRMYREAYRKLCGIIPIEYFSFLTNDSGGGINWSQGLYPGANGPASSRNKNMKDRYIDFLSAIQQGAADAGIKASVNLFGSIPEFEVDAVVPSLPDGMSIKGKTRDGSINTASISKGGFYASNVYPVVGIPQMFKCVQQISNAFGKEDIAITVSFENLQSTGIESLLRQYDTKPYHNYQEQVEALYAVAGQMVGAENAPELVAAWKDIYLAVNNLDHIEGGGPILLLGPVNQRWLNRPLVPFQDELTGEERDYYRKYQFQANTEKEANDYNNLQAYELTRGFSGQYLASQLLESAQSHINKAAGRINRIAANLDEGETKAGMELLVHRLHALDCVIENAINTISFAYYMEITGKDEKPEENTQWHVPPDWRLRDLQVITRAEIDNTYQLIRLLEATDKPLIFHVKDEGKEDIFQFGPNLADQLRIKAETMLNHQMDYNRLYRRMN